MENFKHFLTFGSIKKEENLTSIEHDILNNTLVLENLSPFPGYHHDVPMDPTPNFLFLVLDQAYKFDDILRATKNLKKYFNVFFDACPGSIWLHNNQYPCIRIRGLEKFAYLPELQTCYTDEGIAMHKSKNIDSKAIIKLNKTFSLEFLQDGIYKDLVDKHMYYVALPVQLKWKAFEKVTYSVKNNLDNSNFDAAVGYFFMNDVTDFVRIYAQDPTMERLETIRQAYHDEISRMLKD